VAESIKTAEILVDETLYPRHKISSGNVSSIKEALLAGGEGIPPILINAKTKVLVDGMHRLLANKAVYGEDGKIQAELKSYASRKEMVEDAIRVNARQGLRLTAWDMARSINMMLDQRFAADHICEVLCISRNRYDDLSSRLKRVKGTSEIVAVKANNPKLASQETITKEQAEFVKGPMSGMPIEFHLRQIIAAFESDSITVDEKMEALISEVIDVLQEVIRE